MTNKASPADAIGWNVSDLVTFVGGNPWWLDSRIDCRGHRVHIHRGRMTIIEEIPNDSHPV